MARGQVRQNAFQLNVDLQRFAKKINADMSFVVRKILLEAHAKIMMRTPVDTGRARASWGMSKSRPGTETAAAGVQPPRNNYARVAMSASVDDLAYARWFIYNNLPYIVSLEYGHSKQAPKGMVRLTLAEIEAEIEGMTG